MKRNAVFSVADVESVIVSAVPTQLIGTPILSPPVREFRENRIVAPVVRQLPTQEIVPA